MANGRGIIITVKYQSRPGSNVGGYVARTLGKQRMLVDQSVSNPKQGAAQLLADALVEQGILNEGATVREIGMVGSGKFEVVD